MNQKKISSFCWNPKGQFFGQIRVKFVCKTLFRSKSPNRTRAQEIIRFVSKILKHFLSTPDFFVYSFPWLYNFDKVQKSLLWDFFSISLYSGFSKISELEWGALLPYISQKVHRHLQIKSIFCVSYLLEKNSHFEHQLSQLKKIIIF